MIIPIITGDGRRIELDSDDYPRSVLAEACEGILPELWGLFAGPTVSAQKHPATACAGRHDDQQCWDQHD